jgi:hypothetical protein
VQSGGTRNSSRGMPPIQLPPSQEGLLAEPCRSRNIRTGEASGKCSATLDWTAKSTTIRRNSRPGHRSAGAGSCSHGEQQVICVGRPGVHAFDAEQKSSCQAPQTEEQATSLEPTSGLFVAASSSTPGRPSKPSSSVSSWFRVWSLSSFVPKPRRPPATETTHRLGSFPKGVSLRSVHVNMHCP